MDGCNAGPLQSMAARCFVIGFTAQRHGAGNGSVCSQLLARLQYHLANADRVCAALVPWQGFEENPDPGLGVTGRREAAARGAPAADASMPLHCSAHWNKGEADAAVS